MTHWYQEKKREHFYQEAKRKGYRARSAFKLKQIHNRFNIFSIGDIVIDLGAAPGGWSQVATEYIGEQGLVISIDLQKIKPIPNVITIQGDMLESSTLHAIKKQLPTQKVNVVLSDMSPDISGNYSIDQARSAWLCTNAYSVAEQLLHPDGIFVCKIFEGEETNQVLRNIKHRFYIVKNFSPNASRKSSSEIYIIAKTLKNVNNL
jgi:23S rRNA (uridine2552-2'-O)-methyltransferase